MPAALRRVTTLILDTPLNVSFTLLIFYFSVSEHLLDLIRRILYHTCDILVPIHRLGATVQGFYTQLPVQAVMDLFTLFCVDAIWAFTYALQIFLPDRSTSG